MSKYSSTVLFLLSARMRGASVILFALVAVAAAVPVVEHVDNKVLLQRQRDIYRLLNHVQSELYYPELIEVAKKLQFSDIKTQVTEPHVYDEFMRYYNSGFLPRYQVYSASNSLYPKQSIALFNMMYYAPTYDLFYDIAVWARANVNEHMFVYVLYTAVLHRPDTQGLILPAPYEVLPQYYVNADVTSKARYVKQNRLGATMDNKEEKIYGIKQYDDHYYIYANYSGWLTGGDTDESKLTYFMEDVALNAYHFYFSVDYPQWMGGDEYGLKKDRRGELYYYFYQQLLARYYLERLSNGYGKIPSFSWYRPVNYLYMPLIRHSNGHNFPIRLYDYDLKTEENYAKIEETKEYEKRIRTIIERGYFIMPDGSHISIKNPEDFDVFANLVQSNADSPNTRFYKNFLIGYKMILGNSFKTTNKLYTSPSVLDYASTSLRDPIFWSIYKVLVEYFFQFKDNLPAYTKNELNFPGIKIKDIQVDKLITFFDYYNIDITNTLPMNINERTSQKEDAVFYARQLRLNHVPFQIKIDVASDKAVDSVVRIFLGPKYDFRGQIYGLDENKYNFIELDTFLFTLKTGENNIIRNSNDFHHISNNQTASRYLYKQVESAINGGQKFVFDNSESHFGFPENLLLPKGTKGGLPFQIYVIVSPFRQPEVPYGTGFDESMSSGVGSGARYLDSRALGYPFDRPIEEVNWNTPNMHFEQVHIFHKTDYYVNFPHYYYGQDKIDHA